MSGLQRRHLAVVAFAALFADALTKLAALRWLAEPLDVAGLTLRVTRNPGVAFSLGADQPAAIVLTVTGLAMVALTVAAWRGHLGGPVLAGLLVGGGLANVADRAVGGSVIDLFDPGWWPVFNLADVFITAGVAFLLLGAFVPSAGSHADQEEGELETASDGHDNERVGPGGHS